MLFGLRLPGRGSRPGTPERGHHAELGGNAGSSAARSADIEEMPDAWLILHARQGSLPAFNQLVRRHERAVYSVALRYLRSPERAEDVSQDTFIRAWRALDTFRNDSGEGFRTWLLTIAANRARDVLRASSRRPAESLDARVDDEDQSWEPESTDESPAEFAARDELGARLERALGMLSPDQRMVVILSDVQGNSYEEIADITGVAIGTVKSRLNRARARLRELLLADEAGRELLGRHARLESGDERG